MSGATRVNHGELERGSPQSPTRFGKSGFASQVSKGRRVVVNSGVTINTRNFRRRSRCDSPHPEPRGLQVWGRTRVFVGLCA